MEILELKGKKKPKIKSSVNGINSRIERKKIL